MCIEFWSALANVYKVFARTGSMYMEFWLALGNIYRVLMTTAALLDVDKLYKLLQEVNAVAFTGLPTNESFWGPDEETRRAPPNRHRDSPVLTFLSTPTIRLKRPSPTGTWNQRYRPLRLRNNRASQPE